jgi:hypothetical protein
MNADDRITYLQSIWSVFQEKAKTQRPMSSSEYNLARKWADKNIPLAIVFRAFTDFKGKPRRLEALEDAVSEAQACWVQAAGLL